MEKLNTDKLQKVFVKNLEDIAIAAALCVSALTMNSSMRAVLGTPSSPGTEGQFSWRTANKICSSRRWEKSCVTSE